MNVLNVVFIDKDGYVCSETFMLNGHLTRNHIWDTIKEYVCEHYGNITIENIDFKLFLSSSDDITLYIKRCL